jgi:hypothetical protein
MAVGTRMLVQVFLHPPGEQLLAEAGAKVFDLEAEWRGFTSLSMRLNQGTRVAIQLDCDDLEVNEGSCNEILWQSQIVATSFVVSAPTNADPGKRFSTARLFAEGVPVGRIHFVVEVVTTLAAEVSPQPRGDSTHRYCRAFISYAAEDRAEVMKRVQTLRALKINFFQDLINLDPGDRWKRRLFTEIEMCDVFLLFWSSASQRSMWVRRETLYAIKRQRQSERGEPEIVPVLIEGPPPPLPWRELSHLHFNDELIYLMRVH